MTRPSVAFVAPSLDVLGGQGVQAHALMQSLRADGYQASLVPINPRFPKPMQRLRDYRYLRTAINEGLYLPQLQRLRSADVVHIFSASYWSFLLAPAPAILAAKLFRKPVVLHYHSGEAGDHLANWRSVRRFLRLVDRIVVPSAFLESVFASHGFAATVMPNIIDLSQFRYRERAAVRPNLLSVRNLEDHYRIENTLLAFEMLKARYPEATLTIAGQGSRERQLRQIVDDRGISGVRFTGAVNPGQLPALYDSADVFLNSSVVDNQPVSILEAFGAGLPVVSTPTGDIPNMLRGGDAGLLVPHNDPRAMADAVAELIEHRSLASCIAKRARKEVERYTWDAVGEQWAAVYHATTKVPTRPKSKLQRLRQMDASEILGRSKQEAFKRIERLTARRQRRQRVRNLSFERFVENARQTFFSGVFDPQLPMALALAAPEHCREVVATAEKICRGSFDLLGYSNLDFGNPPNWSLDPVSGRQAPLVHWTHLDPMDYATIGDSKITSELNRHQWLVRLGQAYRLTRDDRYADALVQFLRSWLASNPPGFGINWTSSLELALRLIAWSWSLLLIRDSRAMSEEFFAEVVESVNAQATHIERHLSHYFSPNTHLTGEALGLLYVGLLFPELENAERRRRVAIEILEDQSEKQILPDGIYFELSTCYQRYTADTYLHLLILAGRDISPVVAERVRSLLDFLAMIRNPDASMPNIGDADGGWLLPLSKTHSQNVRPTFSTAAVFFSDPQYAGAAQYVAPDTLWLLGTSALEIFSGIRQTSPSESCKVFEAGGFAVMRTGWNDDSHALIFDTGAFNRAIRSGHEHADLLSVQCSVFGKPYIVDAGTCCYAADEELRNFCRGTSGHSTVVVDGECQAEPRGPFAWHESTEGRLQRWTCNETLAFADSEHDGYTTLRSPVFHRRRVVFVKNSYWVVIDDLTGVGRHKIDIRFQFAPMEVYFDAGGWRRATIDGQRGLLLRTLATVPMQTDIRIGCRAPLEGWIAPEFGRLEPAPAVVSTLVSAVPLRVVTVLWPSMDVQFESPSVGVLKDKGGRIAGLEFPDRMETLMFGDGEPILERSRTRVAEAV